MEFEKNSVSLCSFDVCESFLESDRSSPAVAVSPVFRFSRNNRSDPALLADSLLLSKKCVQRARRESEAEIVVRRNNESAAKRIVAAENTTAEIIEAKKMPLRICMLRLIRVITLEINYINT